MVDILDNFLNPPKLFLGCGKRFHKIIMTQRIEGVRRERLMAAGYSKSGERWVERAEA
jgi:hypothetical protein